MVVRMRHTKGHSANRRSHHALKNRALTQSPEGTVHPRHRVVLEGGTYRGRTMLNIKGAKVARRTAKNKKTAPTKKTNAESKDKERKA